MKLRKSSKIVQFAYTESAFDVPDSVNIWILFWRVVGIGLVLILLFPIALIIHAFEWAKERNFGIGILPVIQLVDDTDVENDMEN